MLRHSCKNQSCSKCFKNLESKFFFENWRRPAEKTEIFRKRNVLFCSIKFIKFLTQFFWSTGQGSELQILRSWVQTPLRKHEFIIFCVCFFGQKLVYSILWYIKKLHHNFPKKDLGSFYPRGNWTHKHWIWSSLPWPLDQKD